MSRIDEIEERWSKATPGPWGQGHHVGEPRALTIEPGGMESLLCVDADGMAMATSEADATAIAHAPEDIGHLIRIARAAEEVVGAFGFGPTDDMDRCCFCQRDWNREGVHNDDCEWVALRGLLGDP